MKIVASNSLTLSNVNDGTITHTAYAYSADGTDRFTTTYPNLNLLVNSSAKTKDGFFKNFDKVENDYGEVTIKGINTYAGKDLWDAFSIKPRDYKPGDKYTISMDVMFTSWNLPAGTTLTEFWMGQRYTQNSAGTIGVWKKICYIDLPRDPSQMLNQWIRVTQTSTIPPYEDPSVNTEAKFMTKFTGASEGSFTIRVRKPKQEQGSIATPYMQSSSEVTTADWPSYRGEYSDFTQADSTNPSDYTWGIMRGNDGVGVKSTVITYAMSTSGTTAPSTGWTSSVPTLVKGQYLWTKTVWVYTDNSSETGYSVTYISKDGNNGTDGIAGKDGVGIRTTAITYASHTNGTTAPTTGYTTAVPSVPAGQFLWTKTVWTYTDNSTETGYSVAMMGVKGDKGDQGIKGTDGIAGKDGKGIKATAITYQASTNGTTAPTGTWSATVPTVAKGSFLWTRTIWTYTDNTTETGYAVAYMGTNGNNGTNGLAGKDGVGIQTTTITYAGSTSGTTAPTSGWTSTVPTVAAGSYLWTKTVWAYTDNTSETGYSVAKMGLKGDKGDPGTPGTPGTPGQNGADAWSVIMSNENVTLPANAQGGVLGYANSGTSISVMYGTGTAFTPAASGATLANNQFKVSASASNITAGTQTVDTTNKKINYTVASGMNTTSGAVASITYTISIRNSLGVTSTVTKVQNFTKAEKGITGDKGIDSYTYIRYSASSNGASMTNLPGADSLYIGTCTTTQSTAPTAAGSYVWAKFVGANGAKGDPTGITRSTTEPATRYTGMLWQYTGTVNLAATGITALPSSLYVWTGSAWQLYLVKSTNLQVDNGFITNAMIGDATIESAKIKSLEATKINANNLAAISANLGDITGGSYTSWTVDIHPSGDPILNGIYMYNGRLRSVSIINPISIDPKEVGGIINSSISGMEMFGGYTDYYYGEYNLVNGTAEDMIKGINGMSFWSQRNDTGAYIGRIVGFQLPDKDPYLLISTPRLLVAGDIDVAGDISIGSGQITAETLTNKGWQNVTGFVNGVQNDNVPLQYKVTINMDNTRTIKFRGGFKGSGTSNIPELGVVQLPVEARPTTTIAFPCMGNGARIARIIIDANGWIQFNVASGSSISGFKAVLLSNVFYEI